MLVYRYEAGTPHTFATTPFRPYMYYNYFAHFECQITLYTSSSCNYRTPLYYVRNIEYNRICSSWHNYDAKNTQEKASVQLTLSIALQSISSEKSWKGSRLSRSVAENKTGSCGMMEIRLRKYGSPSFVVSILSILILPSRRASLNSADMSDDLPAPVRPTIPTCNKSTYQHTAQMALHPVLDTTSLM